VATAAAAAAAAADIVDWMVAFAIGRLWNRSSWWCQLQQMQVASSFRHMLNLRSF
jgi:hypothetical protein